MPSCLNLGAFPTDFHNLNILLLGGSFFELWFKVDDFSERSLLIHIIILFHLRYPLEIHLFDQIAFFLFQIQKLFHRPSVFVVQVKFLNRLFSLGSLAGFYHYLLLTLMHRPTVTDFQILHNLGILIKLLFFVLITL
jgi:hypothetical protein